MAYTSGDLAAVRAALLKGERRVEYADRVVEYRSITELQRLEQSILSELQNTTRVRQVKVVADKGLRC